MEFNSELHEVLLECELHIYGKENGIEVVAFVPFWKLEGLTAALTPSDFDEGGIRSSLINGFVCVELQELFECNEYQLKDYKACFSESEFEEYANEIKAFDGDLD